jgi:hypothetical protein
METPEYFDNITIGQFALTGLPLMVFVDGRYLNITDPDDIEDDDFGFGMDTDGELYPFDYRMVTHLNVGGEVIDLKTYAKALEDESKQKDKQPEPKKTDDKEKSDKKEKSDTDSGEKEQKNPFESITRLRDLISELSKDEFDAQMDALKAEEEAGKAKIKAAKDKMNDLKKQPIEEATKLKFMSGDIIQNKDKECDAYGAIGVVQNVFKDDDIENVIYRITNNGMTFKTGDLRTNRADQLKMYTKDDLMPQPTLPKA